MLVYDLALGVKYTRISQSGDETTFKHFGGSSSQFTFETLNASSNPIQSIHEIRLWLYNLHSQINSRNEKLDITIDQISEIYSKPFNFTYHYSFIIEQMKRALRHKWSNHKDIQCTSRFLFELKCFYDLF